MCDGSGPMIGCPGCALCTDFENYCEEGDLPEWAQVEPPAEAYAYPEDDPLGAFTF